jgi:hypothetical protein
MSFKLKQNLGNMKSGWKKMGDLSTDDMKKMINSDIGHYLNEKHYNMIAQEYALQTKNYGFLDKNAVSNAGLEYYPMVHVPDQGLKELYQRASDYLKINNNELTNMTWGPANIIEDPRRHTILKKYCGNNPPRRNTNCVMQTRGQHQSNLRTRRINKESRFQDKSKNLNNRERHNAQINKNHIHRLTNSRRFSKKKYQFY